MAFGPLIGVKTQVAAVRLDVRRALNYPAGLELKFVKPDATEVTRWATLLTLTNGYNRMDAEESERREGHSVIFRIANLALTDDLPNLFRIKDLHLLFQGTYYKVITVPKVSPGVAQVYDVTCAERTLKTTFETAR